MKETKKPKYSVGDIVRLRSEKKEMTIEAVKMNMYTKEFLGEYLCCWLMGTKKGKDWFVEGSLTIVQVTETSNQNN